MVLAGLDGSERSLWELWPSGRLQRLPAEEAYVESPRRPALVEARVKPKAAWVRADYDFAAAQQQLPAAERLQVTEPWLVGVWAEMQLDPLVWGITAANGTCVPLLHLTVRHARQLIAHQRALDRLSSAAGRVRGYADSGAAWPASWAVHAPDPDPAEVAAAPIGELPSLGIPGLEERWRRSAIALAAQPADDPSAIDRVPAWLDLSQPRAARLSPADRESQRGQEPASHPLRPGYSAAWARLRDPTLHRPFRVTCWRLLHGVLGCRAFLAHVRRQPALAGADHACCQAPACVAAGAVETLTHAFLLCPDVAPVIDWLLATWAQLTAQPAPPRLASLLLADDLASWPQAPQDAATLKMWTRLRVATLGAIWQLRCARADSRASQPSFARQAVELAVGHLRSAIQRDWQRTQADLRQQDDGAFCVDWWRGFDSTLSQAQFVDQWAAPPILCRVEGGPVERLVLRIGVDTPVPWPDSPAQPVQPLQPAPAVVAAPALPAAAYPSPQSPSQPSDDSQPECPICRRHFSAARPAVQTACHHSFHADCLQRWASRSPTCPMCRQQLASGIG